VHPCGGPLTWFLSRKTNDPGTDPRFATARPPALPGEGLKTLPVNSAGDGIWLKSNPYNSGYNFTKQDNRAGRCDWSSSMPSKAVISLTTGLEDRRK